MGTSTRNRKFTEGAVIPWKFVPYGVCHALVDKLNPEMPYSGNDWRMLASKLGYSQREIKFIESEKDTNTNLLFKMYSQRQESSVNKIYTCLEEMGRRDCLDIIDEAYEDIAKIATDKSPTHPNDQVYGTAGELSGGLCNTCSVKCPIQATDAPICTSHCSCLCSAFIFPFLESHPDYPRRTAAFMHLINNGTFASPHSPQHSLTIDHGRLSHSQLKHLIRHMVPALRKKKVFVTYSKDNKKHGKEVLSLCISLLKCGIACYVDCKEADVSLDWCTKKMSKADFILVCVSPKYLQDIGLGDSSNYGSCQQGSEQQLHTKEIYAQMESQCRNAHCTYAVWQAKVVLVLFGGASAAALPCWMTSPSSSFLWPEQHKELIVKVWDMDSMLVKETALKAGNKSLEPSQI